MCCEGQRSGPAGSIFVAVVGVFSSVLSSVTFGGDFGCKSASYGTGRGLFQGERLTATVVLVSAWLWNSNLSDAFGRLSLECRKQTDS